MRIGLTFDLQTDPQDERQAEFDPPATIAARPAPVIGTRAITKVNAAPANMRPAS